MTERQRLVIEERRYDQRPAMAEDADQPPTPALLPGRTGHGRKRGERKVSFRFAAHGQHPPGGEGESQPEACCPVRIGHPGVLPLPAAPLDFFETLFDPGAQPVPTGVGGLGRQIGEEQPRRLMPGAPIGQQGAVQACFFPANAVPRPCHRRPTTGTQWVNG